MEVERGCEEGVPHKMFATSEAILETSSELSIEADGAVVKLISLEEGPGSSIKTKCYYLLTKPLVTKGRGVHVWYSNSTLHTHASHSTLSRYVRSLDSLPLPWKYNDNRGRLVPS